MTHDAHTRARTRRIAHGRRTGLLVAVAFAGGVLAARRGLLDGGGRRLRTSVRDRRPDPGATPVVRAGDGETPPPAEAPLSSDGGVNAPPKFDGDGRRLRHGAD